MSSLKKEIKSSLYLILFVIFFIFVMYILSISMSKVNLTQSVLFLVSYIFIIILLDTVRNKFNNKIFDYIHFIITLPIALFYSIALIVIPIGSVIAHVIYYFLFSSIIPFVVVILNDYFHIIDISNETKVFVVLTASVVIAITFCDTLLNLTYIFSPSRIKTSKKVKVMKLDDLTEHIINVKNIRFFIYSVFFIYLVIYSYKTFEQSSKLSLNLYDEAILQSFLCVLAFDKVLSNIKNVVFLPSTFLAKLIGATTRRIDEVLGRRL